MAELLNKLIGKSRLEIMKYAEIRNMAVDFSITKGHKDTDILNEEYAVRANYKDDRIHVILSIFKTAI